MIDPAELKAFVTLAKTRSYTAAAKELRLSSSSVSKIIVTLEKRLRKKLFLRTTRHVHITVDGEELLPLAKKALESLRETEEFFSVRSRDTVISGTIRITCSHTFALRQLAPILMEFHIKYPDVQVDLVLVDTWVNLIDSGIDMAIRIMNLEDSSYIARKLCDNQIIMAAAPAYLKNKGVPRKKGDLKKHNLLYIATHADLKFDRSQTRLGDLQKSSWSEVTNGDFLVELAKSGAGIVIRPHWGIAQEIDEGSLQPIQLNERLVTDSAVYAVYPVNQYMPGRLKVWVQHLVDSFQEQ
ncbi:MAG: LysR substrate-binding domain-containing protein [Oligoflexales bacterium]